MADQMQIRRFCLRWHTIVIAANECHAGVDDPFDVIQPVPQNADPESQVWSPYLVGRLRAGIDA